MAVPAACIPLVLIFGAILPFPQFFLWFGFAVVFGFFLPKIGIGLGTILAVLSYLTVTFCILGGFGFSESNYASSSYGSALGAFIVGGPFFVGAAGRIATKFLGFGKFLP